MSCWCRKKEVVSVMFQTMRLAIETNHLSTRNKTYSPSNQVRGAVSYHPEDEVADSLTSTQGTIHLHESRHLVKHMEM